MRDSAPADDPTPAQPDDLRAPPAVDLAAALTQMADNYMPFKWMSIKP